MADADDDYSIDYEYEDGEDGDAIGQDEEEEYEPVQEQGGEREKVVETASSSAAAAASSSSAAASSPPPSSVKAPVSSALVFALESCKTSEGLSIASTPIGAVHLKQMWDEVMSVAELLFQDNLEAVLLALVHFKWQKETLQDRCFGEDGIGVDEVFKQVVGLSSLSKEEEQAQLKKTPPKDGTAQGCEYDAAEDKFTCSSTLDSYSAEDFAALACGHFFSKAAWKGHLEAIMEANPQTAALSMRCPMGDGCKELCPMAFVKSILDKTLYDRYFNFILRGFIASNPSIALCPAKGCEEVLSVMPSSFSSSSSSSSSSASLSGSGIIRKPEVGAADVQCRHGHVLCLLCGLEGGHEPATCAEMRLWEREALKEQGDIIFMRQQGFKNCPNPRCSARIERQSGCNKVICRSCQTPFCWNCLRFPFTQHHKYPEEAWNCTDIPKEDEGEDEGEGRGGAGGHSQKGLDKIVLWAYQGYQDHSRALELTADAKAVKALEEVKEDAAEYFSLSQSEARLFNHAHKTLLASERAIRTCYVRSFFWLKRCNAMGREIKKLADERSRAEEALKAQDQAVQLAGGGPLLRLEHLPGERGGAQETGGEGRRRSGCFQPRQPEEEAPHGSFSRG